jgi:tetratricopeptide (TPR) repeat protein
MADQGTIRSDTDLPGKEPWLLLQRGELDRGLQMLREEYEARPRSAREILNLGIGLMWAKMYEVAAEHFTAASRRERNGENDFAFAGVAEWQLGKPTVAIQLWRKGLKAQYAVGCRVCSMTARFLVVVAALEPDLFSRREAETALLNAIERLDSSKWSALLGRYLLGQTERTEMESWINNGTRDMQGRSPLLWLTDFYCAARRLRLAEIDSEEFRSLLPSMVSSICSSDTETASFAQTLRNPEYFFASTEAAKVR